MGQLDLDKIKPLLIELDILELISIKFDAQRHWDAGKNNHSWRRWGLVSTIILNAVIASTLLGELKTLGESVHSNTIGLLSLLAAIVSALILQFKPEETMTGHKLMGAEFSDLARAARQLQARLLAENVTAEVAWQQLDALHERQKELRIQAAQYHVGPSITRALDQQVAPEKQRLVDELKAWRERIQVSTNNSIGEKNG